MADNDLTISILNDLIRTSKDGEQCFEFSADYVQDEHLKEFFIRRTHEAATDVAELRELVMSLGGTPVDSPSVGNAWHRYWMDLKTAIDLAVLKEVERGEGVTLKLYRKAAEQSLPPEIKAIVLRQLDDARENYNEVKALHDLAHVAAH